MNEEVLFFDTYAFFEIIRGNPKYDEFRNVIAVTTIFNIAEINYGLKKELNGKTADLLTAEYASLLTEVTVADVQKAMSLRRVHKDLSIPDAIGYTVAQRLKIKFLTGDEDFRNLPNVLLVKK
ncbi:PIN domain-containing protein [archaeon]|nr:PIN domain-containing protein [archaeon]